MSNALVDLLREIVNDAPHTHIVARGKARPLDDPDMPLKPAVSYVKGKLAALLEE